MWEQRMAFLIGMTISKIIQRFSNMFVLISFIGQFMFWRNKNTPFNPYIITLSGLILLLTIFNLLFTAQHQNEFKISCQSKTCHLTVLYYVYKTPLTKDLYLFLLGSMCHLQSANKYPNRDSLWYLEST